LSTGQQGGGGGQKPNGRSSIYRGGDGKWHGWVTMGVRDDGSPDRRHRTGATETEVTGKVRKLEAQREAGKTSRPGHAPTLTKWMRYYLSDVAPQRVSQNTIDTTYRPKTERWIIPKLGRHHIDRLYPDHLYRFYKSLREDEGLAGNTIVQIHRILSRALTVAVREELISRNPCSLIDAPQPEDTEAEPLTADEARRLLAQSAKRRKGTRWSVGLAMGLRQNEALGLRRSYVDLDRAVFRVHWQIQRARYRHGCTDPHACGERHHIYPCPPDCPKAKRKSGRKHVCRKPCPPRCDQHDGKCPEFCAPDCTGHAKACPQRKGGWCMPDGRPIDPHDDWDEWKELLAEADVTKDARLHDARHTCGTLLGEQHVDMHVIQAILGHAQVSTTRIYTDPTDNLQREAMGKLGSALWPDAGDQATGQQRIAEELRAALEANDIEQIQCALRAAQEWAAGASPEYPGRAGTATGNATAADERRQLNR
jgi:integrase